MEISEEIETKKKKKKSEWQKVEIKKELQEKNFYISL